MRTLLCLHGSGHTADSFSDQRAAIADCCALSLPGHPHGPALTSVGACVDWLEEWRRAAAIDRPVIAGNSLGGAIGLAYALRYPDSLAGLVLIGTGARLKVAPSILRMLAQRWPACIDDLIDYTLSAAAGLDLRSRLENWHVTVGQESTVLDYRACDEFDVMNDVRTIAVPSLIIVGSADRMTPPKYSEYLARSIDGSQLRIVEGAGHMPHAEQPSLVNAMICEFLADRAGA
ncbi:MAG: alpha/beta hydrolase [Candidatus Eremiobacteraeota bacterium]|nr:alpha/beta hydrolase [Candidatus Eremiobacteraeota bacterium]